MNAAQFAASEAVAAGEAVAVINLNHVQRMQKKNN